MVRDNLCITVPSFFKCPISLDVMKSPVSLCTGVTYDRSSIQRWLDNGNNTCPATMQVLQTKDFVPNRTLHSLIRIWSESVTHRVDPPDSKSVLSRDQVLQAIIDMDTRSENRFSSLVKLVRFAEDCEDNRVFLAKINRLVPLLVGFLDNVDGGVTGSVDFLEQVVKALSLVMDKIEDCEGLKDSMLKGKSGCLDSLLLVLQRGSSDSKIASARVLNFIALDTDSKLLIADKEGLVNELLNLVTPEKDPALIEIALASLVAISTPKRNKLKLVNLGAVKTLSELLSESNLNVAVVEKVLKLMETTSSTREGRREICEDAACLAAILNKVLKVSSVATEHAMTTLWSVCYLFGDHKAQEAVTHANGLTKILLLMQSNCSPQVRQMCTDLLMIFRVNSKSCLSCYDTKTTHIMPF
ncbi:U-box domain-containing protein 27-like [Gastrolobium bilobum]|uniref:U-box domain-containing protein 27-like n=1 Tax=Gastrolobium bilobum TaxID=150636 RepID=UPI002AAFE128|nr:U-box domain-containing protein 27-like [Gastrolobium bilobum]